MDSQSDRKQFLAKGMAYACSYDPVLRLEVDHAIVCPEGVRMTLGSQSRRKDDEMAPLRFFHVLDALSVTGLDQREHDCPVGPVRFAEESLLFRRDAPVAHVQGRLTLHTELASGRTANIDVKYQGLLRFRGLAIQALEQDGAVEASAFLIPEFETMDTRFRWLTARRCLAFGTWSISGASGNTGVRWLSTHLDVYTAG
jgi:hypothetical protein